MNESVIELPSSHSVHSVVSIPSRSSFSGSSENNNNPQSTSSGGEHPHISSTVESNIINVIDNSYNASLPQIVFLGLGIVLGGTVVGWNKGVEEGFWAYFISYVVIAIGYLMLVLCLAELTSIMAFAGGAYGYVRCAVSPFLGYLLGCCEILQSNLFVVCCIFSMGNAITKSTGLRYEFEILYFIIIYIAVLAFHIPGGRYFWLAMTGCAMLTVVTILLYCLAALFADPNFLYANITTADNYRIEGWEEVHPLHQLYLPAWFFIGSETLILAGAKIANGTHVIPKALTINYSILILLATWVLFTTITQYHDGNWKDLIRTDYPLSYGLNHSLQIPMYISPLLTLLPNYSSALGFMYAAKHSMQSMALSGLFPSALKRVYGSGKVPVRALLTCTGLQFITLMFGWALVRKPPFFELCMLAASCSYIGVFTAYIVFKKHYAGMERSFHNPLGVYGAYTGICVFLLVIISIIGFRVTSFALPIFVMFLFCMTLYYYFVAESRQGFSIEEQKRFMRAYILNSNNRRKKKTLKHYPKTVWYMKVWVDLGRLGYFLVHWRFPTERVHVYHSNTHAPVHPHNNSNNNSRNNSRNEEGINALNRPNSTVSTQARTVDPMQSQQEDSARSVNTMISAALAVLFHPSLLHHQSPVQPEETGHSNAHQRGPLSFNHHYPQQQDNTSNPPSLQTPPVNVTKQTDEKNTNNLTGKKPFFSSFFPHKTLSGGMFSAKLQSQSTSNNISSGSSNSSFSGTQQNSYRVASSGNSSIKISIRHSSVPPTSPNLNQVSPGNGLTAVPSTLLSANVDVEAGGSIKEVDDEYALHRCSTILSEKYVPASDDTSGRSHATHMLAQSATEIPRPHDGSNTTRRNHNDGNNILRQSSQTFSDMSSCPPSAEEQPVVLVSDVLSPEMSHLHASSIDSVTAPATNYEHGHYHRLLQQQQEQQLQGVENSLHVEDASSVVSGRSLPSLPRNGPDLV